jgi:hypothetical protein
VTERGKEEQQPNMMTKASRLRQKRYEPNLAKASDRMEANSKHWWTEPT